MVSCGTILEAKERNCFPKCLVPEEVETLCFFCWGAQSVQSFIYPPPRMPVTTRVITLLVGTPMNLYL